jgi:hypothetical protein
MKNLGNQIILEYSSYSGFGLEDKMIENNADDIGNDVWTEVEHTFSFASSEVNIPLGEIWGEVEEQIKNDKK